LTNKIIQVSLLTRGFFAVTLDDLVEVQGLESLAANRREEVEFRSTFNKITK